MRFLMILALGATLCTGATSRADEVDADVVLPQLLREIGDLRKSVDKDSRARDEAAALRVSLEQARKESVKLQEEVAALKVKLAGAEVEVQMGKKQAETLEKLVAGLQKPEPRVLPETQIERPEREVRGKVSSIANAGLYVLSVGGEEGLKQGITLEVYRPGETPRLLGTMTLVRSYAKQSIAQFKSLTSERAEVGDEVVSRGTPK